MLCLYDLSKRRVATKFNGLSGALVTNEKAYQNAQKPHIQQISAKYCDLEAAKTITKITTLTMTTTTTP